MTGRETAASCSATPSVNQDENPVKKKRETDEDECSVFTDAATTFSFRSYSANKQVYSLFKKQSFGLSFEITFMLKVVHKEMHGCLKAAHCGESHSHC